MGYVISVLLIVMFIAVALAVCGMAAWGTTTAMTGLTLATGNLVNQVTIALLVLALVAVVALCVFVAVKAFNVGRQVERRRAAEDIDDLEHQLETARRTRAQLPAQQAVLLLPPPAARTLPAEPKHARVPSRRVSSSARAALRTAKRWFQ